MVQNFKLLHKSLLLSFSSSTNSIADAAAADILIESSSYLLWSDVRNRLGKEL